MDIVLCIDNNYIMPCGIMMISVLENNKNTSVIFHILGTDLEDVSKEKLLGTISPYPNVSIRFYDIKQDFLESYNFSLYGAKHMSLTTYSRLFLQQILPSDINKVLYMDCDVIVSGNLSELWNTNIEKYSIAGVPDLYCMYYRDIMDVWGYDHKFGYVNAGMLLINLEYWRKQNLQERFLNFYKENHHKIMFYDQDIINGVLYDSKFLLPMKYNVLDSYYSFRRKSFHKYDDEVADAIRFPVVIHYTASDKPWLKQCVHPLKSEFFRYGNLSPWKNFEVKWRNESFSKKIQYYKRKILCALKLRKPRYIDISLDLKP